MMYVHVPCSLFHPVSSSPNKPANFNVLCVHICQAIIHTNTFISKQGCIPIEDIFISDNVSGGVQKEQVDQNYIYVQSISNQII